MHYNSFITRRKLDIDNIILRLITSGEISQMTATDIKNCALAELAPEPEQTEVKDDKTFLARFRRFADMKTGRTLEVYNATFKHIRKFASNCEELKFEDITKEWLTNFNNHLAKTSPSANARNIHLRNIRAVFNEAIDDEITTFYPFRKFKIKGVATPKRSLSLEELRTLFEYPVEEHAEKYVDMFKLISFLIGINLVDLCNLKEIKNGRVEFYRSKTKRLYSIKVEQEALELINKYRGKKQLLDISDRYKDHKNYLQRCNRTLQLIGETEVGKKGKKTRGKRLFPEITTYWARHTWATIAAELEIPKETIAAALGHGGNTVTDIYINFNQKKVDEANRKVIDYVLYDK